MMPYQVFLFVFLFCFLSSNALVCTTNCFFTYNLTTPFSIPDRCNQSIPAGKCTASVSFWYNRGQYDVSFRADPSGSVDIGDNRRHVLLQFDSNLPSFFNYGIDRACANQDDCARDLIRDVATEMLQRQYSYSAIMNEVQPVIVGPPLTPDNPNVHCYDPSQKMVECGTSTKPGSCVISDTISLKQISIECDDAEIIGNTYISMYQSDDDYAVFDVHCNRSLCNTQSTLQTAKHLMFKYNVTATPDGLLYNLSSRLILSSSLMIVMISFLLFNRF